MLQFNHKYIIMKKAPQYLENGKALKGHDPINVYNGMASVGSREITTVFEDAIYQFASVENKNIFDEDPSKYTLMDYIHVCFSD